MEIQSLGFRDALPKDGWTSERFLTETPKDCHGLQILDGRLLVNEATFDHQFAALEVQSAFREWTRDHGGFAIPPMDIVIDDATIFAPDAILLLAGHPRPDKRFRVPEVPDLCVEMVSVSSQQADVTTKLRKYERAGVPEYWVLDLRRQRAWQWRRPAPGAPFAEPIEHVGDVVLTAPLAPGLEVDTATLRAD